MSLSDIDVTAPGLERYEVELDVNGLTIVPPDTTGVSVDLLDHATRVLLDRFTEITGGCPISVAEGPMGELQFSPRAKSRFPGTEEETPDPTQMLIHQLLPLDRCFRDLVVNPIANALIDHLMGPEGNNAPQLPGAPPPKARRLSSVNSFVKWQGDYGYGPNLGLHVDQNGSPMPWGRISLNANAMWCLTEYSKEGGALAYVPGSHKWNARPTGINEAHLAVPVMAPRGSLVVWHGATWHGAFPKLTPGLRLNVTNYYRHLMVLPQDNLRITMADQPWDDCDDPDVMCELLGFNDRFPYTETQPPPRFVK